MSVKNLALYAPNCEKTVPLSLSKLSFHFLSCTEAKIMPILSLNGKNLLFIHVPKCGGSSIEEWAKANGFTVLLEMRGLPPQEALFAAPQHLTMNQLKSIVRLDNIDYAFMFVRNPVNRIQSEYCWSNRERLKSKRKKIPFSASKGITSSSATDPQSVESWLVKVFDEYKRNPFVMDNHIRPASEFIGNEWDKIEIFKLEDGFTKFLAKMSEIFGKSFSNIPHAKKSASSSHIKLNNFSLNLIKNFYEDDFLNFEFDFPSLT